MLNQIIFYHFDCIQQPPSQGQKAKDHQRRRLPNSCHVLNSLAQQQRGKLPPSPLCPPLLLKKNVKPNHPTFFNIFHHFDCIQQPPSQGQKAKDHQRRRLPNSCHILPRLDSLETQQNHLTPVIGLQPIKTINVLHFGCQRITFHVAFGLWS